MAVPSVRPAHSPVPLIMGLGCFQGLAAFREQQATFNVEAPLQEIYRGSKCYLA